MRNVFDQYNHPENRLTHGLMSSLAADPALLRRFIQWATGERAPTGQLRVLEQTLPGEEESTDEEDAERKGLPDGWIHDGATWSLVIESKIQAPLDPDQLQRHRRTAEGRGFTDLHILALVAEQPHHACVKSVTLKKWTELYTWLLMERRSEWARHFVAYMEVLEARLIRDEYLREGMLTVFAGIQFGKDNPYNYFAAKRVLRLAMDELRQRNDLKQKLGMDPDLKGRPAITGRDSTRIWDFLRLEPSKGAANFTEFPHLTLSIQQEQLFVIVTVPHGIRGEFRKNLLVGGRQGFCSIFEAILNNFSDSLGSVEGIAPWIEIIQRRYPSQRAEPIIDARLQFDLRTGFKESDRWRTNVKEQPQWLGAAYDALSKKNSNLQLGVGAIFRYEKCPAVHTPEIVDYIAAAWLACKPLIQAMIV
ncbi:MAG: hypothetical protein RB191_13505 [Terriglobia bacterium]|nr:hypothetical protein [Terriglobia bacterium]